MKLEKKPPSLKHIDLIVLREKGMSRSRLSKIFGVPVRVIDRHLNHQRPPKKYSGVF